MVNNIPVNGWPQLKDLEAVQPILNRLDKIEAWKRTVKEETFTGEVITIDNALALPARSLKTTINAIQDLHGYDNPWAGGAGDNKLDYDKWKVVSITRGTAVWENNGVTLTATGADCYTAQLVDKIPVTGGTTVNISWKETTNRGGYIYLFEYDADGNAIENTNADNANVKVLTKTVAANCAFINFRFGVTTQGATISYKDVMISFGATVPQTWQPYSNLCPISGRTAAVLTRSDGDEISEDFTIQLGQTVYGADINWDTGVMTVKTAYLTVNDFTAMADNVSAGGLHYATTAQLDNFDTSKDVILSILPYVRSGAWASTTPIASYGTKDIRVYCTETSLAAFKTAYADLQLVYPLATPTTIQLTPTQLELLKGYNHITLTDGYGTMELKALTGANWS